MTNKGDLEIRDSRFTNVFSLEEGSVLYAGAYSTTTLMSNVHFENCTSLIGGAIYIQAQSHVRCEYCTFMKNFAIEGGVIAIEENGTFELENCIITRNLAVSGSVANIYNSGQVSTIKNCKIFDNRPIEKQALMNELTVECIELCFLDEVYKEYIAKKDNLLDVISSIYCFGVILGNLSIVHNTHIYNQLRVIDAISSNIIIENSKLSQVTMIEPSIKLRLSDLDLKNVTIDSVNVGGEALNSFITGISESTLKVNGLTYTNSKVPLLSFLRCKGAVENLVIRNVTASDSVVTIKTSTFVSISNIKIQDTQTSNQILISLINSYISKLDNISVSGISQLIFLVDNTTIDLMSNLTISNCKQGINAVKESSVKIVDSEFRNMGDSNVSSGAALYFKDSNLTLDRVQFTNNTSIDGGSIDLTCAKSLNCSYSFSNSNFTKSLATRSGGAIRYDLYRPKFKSIRYLNNSAYYGQNVASYPVKIKVKGVDSDEMFLNNVASGLAHNETIVLILEDHDKQIVKTSFDALIEIHPVDTTAKIKGTNKMLITEGVATFDNLVFVAQPGKKNVQYRVYSKAIDEKVINLQYGTTKYQGLLDVSFRYCMPGEIQIGNM